MIKLFYLNFILLLFCIPAEAQNTKLGKEVFELSNYISSKEFVSLKEKINDLSRTDSLYKEALRITNGKYSEALFALIFTTVPYNEVPIKIPLLPFIINYPLVSANDSLFNLKNENLPKNLFFDSPTDSFGDKDKLAHFFGAAFISYSSSLFDLGDLIGYFVEVFEQNFKVQSLIDRRDLRADELGNVFGKLLKKNKDILPSQVLLIKTFFYLRFNL
jgi:hypothetical protein